MTLGVQGTVAIVNTHQNPNYIHVHDLSGESPKRRYQWGDIGVGQYIENNLTETGCEYVDYIRLEITGHPQQMPISRTGSISVFLRYTN
jgi:hypothetical protein